MWRYGYTEEEDDGTDMLRALFPELDDDEFEALVETLLTAGLQALDGVYTLVTIPCPHHGDHHVVFGPARPAEVYYF